MKKLTLAFLLSCSSALAQTSGTFTTGQSMSAGQLDSALAAKQDYYPGYNTPLLYVASGSTAAQLLAGAIDAAPAVSAAIAVGAVYLPCGTYRFDQKITLPISTSAQIALRGASRDCVVFQVNYAPANLFLAPVGQSWIDIEDINFTATVAQSTAVTALYFTNNFGLVLRNVIFSKSGPGTWYNMIVLDGSNTTHISNVDLRPGASNSCINIVGNTQTTIDTYMDNSSLSGCAKGIVLARASGVYMSDIDVVGSLTNGMQIAPLTPNNVNAVRLQNVLFDTGSGGHGFIVQGTGAVTELHLSKVWSSGSGNSQVGGPPPTFNCICAGFVLNNSLLDGAQLEHVYAHFNGAEGIHIVSGKHIQINDAMTCNNGNFTANTYAGIAIDSGADWVTITNPVSGKCGFMSAVQGYTNQQQYGLTIGNAGTQHITMVGGQFDTNLTGTWTHTVEANFISAATPP